MKIEMSFTEYHGMSLETFGRITTAVPLLTGTLLLYVRASARIARKRLLLAEE